jgi:hypothetical protein
MIIGGVALGSLQGGCKQLSAVSEAALERTAMAIREQNDSSVKCEAEFRSEIEIV